MADTASHLQLVGQVNEMGRQITRHKIELDKHLENTDLIVAANGEELLKIRFWKERLAGMMLVLVPASGVITALVVHFIEKAFGIK